jgi:hypothetical protein
MSNTLATCTVVAKETLSILQNMITFAGNVNRDWQDEFTGNQSRGYSPGTTINIKRPPRYTYRAGRVAVPQSTVETTIPLTLSQGGTDLNFNTLERTLSLQQFEQKMQAAVATVVNEIDRQGCDMARLQTFNTIGTPGTLPNTQALALQSILGLNQRLSEMGAPIDGQRALVMNPAYNAAAVQGLAGMFNAQDKLSTQYRKGMLVDSLGMNIAMDQNIATHVNGTQAVTGTAVAAGLSGSSITCAALGGTITKGTKISFPGVFAVNPQSRVSTGTLAQFVITADLAAAATSLPISPALTASGAFQNASNTTTAANFTIFGTASGSYAANVAFHKDAFTLAMVPMELPPKNGAEVVQMSDNGFTVKVTKFYDGTNDNMIMRLDVLFGWAATYPELACLYAV